MSTDRSKWTRTTVVAEQCPQATLCADPYHLVAWATCALYEVRREVWRQAKVIGSRTMI